VVGRVKTSTDSEGGRGASLFPAASLGNRLRRRSTRIELGPRVAGPLHTNGSFRHPRTEAAV
jgi:hypothetical protein